jgi:DUF971 family protein
MPPESRSETNRFVLTRIKAPHGARVLELGWHDGTSQQIPHAILRGYCPCATCQGHGGPIHFVTGGDLEIREIEPIGNYAVCFKWGDQHGAGLYSFQYLRRLGELFAEHGNDLPTKMPELSRI